MIIILYKVITINVYLKLNNYDANSLIRVKDKVNERNGNNRSGRNSRREKSKRNRDNKRDREKIKK